ncbi:MAG TPA: helix-turn-helix domain-containing protein [Marmoricola sp.]|nr:helix-turn-helix domain-containing protein [Marmoricola sp.]
MTTPRRVTWSGDVPADADDARERILEAAVRCVSRVGVERTSTALIAREAGVSRPTLYAYFANREEIVEQAAEQAIKAIMRRLQEHCRGFEAPADRAVEALMFAVEHIRSEPAMAVYYEPANLRLGPLGSDEIYFATRALEPLFEVVPEVRGPDATELFARQMISMLTRGPVEPRTSAEDRAYLHRWFPRALGLALII